MDNILCFDIDVGLYLHFQSRGLFSIGNLVLHSHETLTVVDIEVKTEPAQVFRFPPIVILS